MERFVFRIQLNGVIAEDQPIDRLGIKNRSVEGFKLIVFNHNATLGSAVEILLLSLQVGNLRIDEITALVNWNRLVSAFTKRFLRIMT